VGVGHGLLDGGHGGVDPALGQAQQGQAGVRLATAGVGLAVGGLGVGQLAPQPVQLAELVVRHPDGGVGRVAEPLARQPSLGLGVVPGSLQLEDLGPVHETLPPVGDEPGLAGAPALERGSPLPGTLEVERLLAGVDDGAVDDARHDGRGLPGGDRDHRLVEQCHALVPAAHPEQRLAPPDGTQSGEIGVSEACRERGGLGEAVERAGVVAARHGHERLGKQEVAALDALEPAVVQQRLGTRQPTATLGRLPPLHEPEAEPESAAHSRNGLVVVEVGLMGADPGGGALLVVAGEMGGDRQPLQVLPLARFGAGEPLVRHRPGALLERFSSLVQQLHLLPDDGSPAAGPSPSRTALPLSPGSTPVDGPNPRDASALTAPRRPERSTRSDVVVLLRGVG